MPYPQLSYTEQQKQAQAILKGSDYSKRSSRNKVVLIGHSIINQNNVSGHISDRGIVSWANILSGQMFDILANLGIGGQRSDQILARFGDALALSPDIIVMDVYTNDISQNVSAEVMFANGVNMYEQAINAGIRVVANTVSPSASWTTTTQLRNFYKVNQLLMDYSRGKEGFYLVDTGSFIAGPTGASVVSGYTVDNTHPSAKGAYYSGRFLADYLQKYFVQRPRTSRLSTGDPFNMTGNGGMVGTTGTVTAGTGAAATGSAPDGWIVAGYGSGSSMTVSKVPRTDGLPGEMVQIEYTGGGTTGSVDFYKDIVKGATTFAEGDKVYAEIEVEYDPTTIITQSITFGATLRVNSPATTNGIYNGLHHETSNPDLGVAPRGTMVIKTPVFTVDSTSDRLRPLLKTYLTSGKFWIKAAQVRKV